MMTFLVHGSRIRFNSAIEKIPELPMEYKGQAPSQKPAPLDQHILSVLFELQHPLRRQHLTCQSLFQHGRLIEGPGQGFEDGFHNVVRGAIVRSPGGDNRSLCFLRQFKANKARCGVQIIFARLVDHAKVAVFFRFLIVDYAIDLALLKVVAILVLHTQDESSVCLFPTHDFSLSPGIA